MSTHALAAPDDSWAQLEELAQLSRMVHGGRRSVVQQQQEEEDDDEEEHELPFMPSDSSEEDELAAGRTDTATPPRWAPASVRGHESYCGLRFGRECDCGPHGGPRQTATVSITNSGQGYGMIIAPDGRVTRYNGTASAAQAAGVALQGYILEVNATATSSKEAIIEALKAVPVGQAATFTLLLPGLQTEAPEAAERAETARPRQPTDAPVMPSDSSEDEADTAPEPEPVSALGFPPASVAPKPQLSFKELFRTMPQEPRYRHRLTLDCALMSRRFVRCRWPLAALWLEPGAMPRAMHVEWRVTPLKKRQSWTVTIFLEPAGGGRGEKLSTHPGCGSDSIVGHVSTHAARQAVRIEVSADEGCSAGAQVEVCCKALPQATPVPASTPEPEPEPESGSQEKLDYPPDAFDMLLHQRDEMIAASGELPTAWKVLPSDDPGGRIPVPFNLSTHVAEMRVVRRFSSKAMPYWLAFKDHAGVTTDVVMKAGDDLRQDQVVLGMLKLFNTIWEREGVMHTLPGGGQVPVHAPVYRCMTCSISSGFVEMLPRSTPVVSSSLSSHKHIQTCTAGTRLPHAAGCSHIGLFIILVATGRYSSGKNACGQRVAIL
eukprot:COSAG03_NODE_571_length_6898_cov_13.957641_2_plen_604_part_00